MIIVGVDEVGRGPLAGPVTVCALACLQSTYTKLKKSKNLPARGIDSKKLKSPEREKFAAILNKLKKEGKINYSISHISNKIIDKRGLSFAIKKGIENSIENLKINSASKILLDGSLKAPLRFNNQKTIIKGDEKEKIISWASILAKVSRDELMKKEAQKYPLYKFELHKGYGTKKHKSLIRKHGLSEIHRKSFNMAQ